MGKKKSKSKSSKPATNLGLELIQLEAYLTEKFHSMVELLLLYHSALTVSEAEARVRAVLHASHPDLGQNAGEQEAPVEEMFRFNEGEDLARVVKMIEKEDRDEWERQEKLLQEVELLEEELNWTVVTKKVKKKKEKVAEKMLGKVPEKVVGNGALGVMGNGAGPREGQMRGGKGRRAGKIEK